MVVGGWRIGEGEVLGELVEVGWGVEREGFVV